jgi:putative ABC transport system permease protein
MSEAKWRRYARLTGSNVRADVDDEMEFHIQIIADRFARDGHSPEDARAMAMREFGNRQRASDECVEIDSVQQRRADRSDWWQTFRQDAKHGARRLIKNPVFSIVTILTLALGIGPNIAIFSIINSVLLEPLPFANPNALVLVQETFPLPGGGTGNGSVSYANFLDWKTQTKSLDLAISSFTGSANFQGTGDPQRLTVARLGANALDVLGVHPLIGRGFTAADEDPSAPAVALIGEGFWRRQFNGDNSVIGKTVLLDGSPSTVVGVLPANITFPNRTVAMDVWQVLRPTTNPTASRGSHNFQVMGRLRPGATVASATADLKIIAARLAQEYPQSQEKRSVAVTSYRDVILNGEVKKQLVTLFGAAVFVLLIACANAASLLLARASAREREVAVLAALGANRWRIAQQFLVESLILSAAGAVAGFALSRMAVAAIIAGAGSSLPRSTQIHFDSRVVIFIAATILVTSVLFGLVPALQATKTSLQDCLRAGGRTGSGGRASSVFRNGLVVGQFALSLVLLTGAGLLLRTFASLLAAPTGMTTEHVLTMQLRFPLGSPKYPTGVEARARFFDPLMERLRALPGVQNVALINLLPLQQTGFNGNFKVAGKSYASIAEQPFAEYRAASPGYFDALRIPLIAGRDFTAADRDSTTPVVIVNQTVAKTLFPNESAVGKLLAFGPISATNPAAMIIGVVGDIRESSLTMDPRPELFFTFGQSGGLLSNVSLVVRTAGNPTLATSSIVSAIRAIDPAQPVYNVKTMTDVVQGSVADRKLYLGLLGTFAGVALALAIAGIYGVMSYGVTQRTREFGIRLALGSETRRVQRLVVWEGTKLALYGIAIGLPTAFIATKLLTSVLYGVTPGDIPTLLGVAVVLGTVSVAASYLPSRRVTSVDPIIAMRAE